MTNKRAMHQDYTCIQYSDAYREIYQQRLQGSPYENLSKTALQAAANAPSLSKLAEVWAMIGAEFRASTESVEGESFDSSYPHLMSLPLKDMIKSMVLETVCREWSGSPEAFQRLVERLFQTADVQEQQLIVLVLPLLDSPKRFLHIATEATRTNIVPVFSALSLHNPYPHEHFSENQWNQMVLKTIFVGCDITQIVGLHRRHNPALAETMFQYVSERHSAGRSISRAVVELCAVELNEPAQLKLNKIKPELKLES